MTVDEIRELIKLATDTGIAELEVQRGDNRVRIRRVAQGVLLEPVIQDPKEWFHKLDELNSEPFPSRRQQPTTPKRTVFK